MGSETQYPEHMGKIKFNFSVLSSAADPILAPRLGRLSVAGRKSISTPHFIPLTTRGVVPHLAHDVVRRQTSISSLFIGLEDFIGKAPKEPPIFKVPTAPHESALRKFICLPDDTLLFLGPRRIPSVVCPPANTTMSISVMTSVGFRQLEADQYIQSIQRLRPDAVIGMADIVLGRKAGVKRRGKMVDRTHAYTRDATERLYGDGVSAEDRSKTAYFAPVLPLDNAEQTLYLDDLEDDLKQFVSGLALYESASLAIVPESLGNLPRLLLSEPATPQDVLREISLGADLLTIPFIAASSDAGLALDFTFPAPSSMTAQEEGATASRPLAIDLWLPTHATNKSSLSEGCQCYTCRNHHRAYLRHLLSAKEMLAWTLLQIHNYHTMDVFFSNIRESIIQGAFEQDVQAFEQTYESALPEPTGEGPRLRGYQLPAPGPNQPRRYPKVYGRLDDAAEKYAESQSSVATPDAGADELQERGFAEKKIP